MEKFHMSCSKYITVKCGSVMWRNPIFLTTSNAAYDEDENASWESWIPTYQTYCKSLR